MLALLVMLPSLQLVLQTTLSSFATGCCLWQREGWGLELLWDQEVPQESHFNCEGTVGDKGMLNARECSLELCQDSVTGHLV